MDDMDTVNFPDGQLGLLFRSITLAVVQAVYDGKHDLAKNTAYAWWALGENVPFPDMASEMEQARELGCADFLWLIYRDKNETNQETLNERVDECNAQY